MLHKPHGLAKLMLPLFFKRIRLEAPQAEAIREAGKHSCIVYISRFNGQLEYLANSQLFAKHQLPLAEAANHIDLLWWVSLAEAWKVLRARWTHFQQHKTFRPHEPFDWENILKPGHALFLHIPQTSLTDPALFHSASQSPLTQLLREAAQKNIAVTLVPVEFVWDRYESKRTSVLDLLGLDPENFSLWRRSILFWKHYFSSASIRVGTPYALPHCSPTSEANAIKEAEDLRLQLTQQLHIERRLVSGTPIRPRSWFLEQIFHDEILLHNVTELAQLNQSSSEELLHIAQKYARRMIAAPDPLIIQMANSVFKWVLPKLFHHIDFPTAAIEQLKQLTREHTVILVPNHRSHMDYILISQLAHDAGLALPMIAAGDNLAFWPLGSFFRRGGAFFIQRSFRNQPLYRLVIEAYLRVLVREHYMLEFFIEGSRSRTGRLLPPKLGLLKMLSQAALETKQTKLIFVPVAINYERTLEIKSYIAEVQGKKKKRETLLDLLHLPRYFTKRRSYGELSIDFGNVLHISPDEQQHIDPSSAQLAKRLIQEIGKHLAITPEAIVASALLSIAPHTDNEPILHARMQILLQFLQERGAALSARLERDGITALHMSLQRLHQDKEEKKLQALEYQKNSLMHLLIIPGLITSQILKAGPMSETELFAHCCQFQSMLNNEFPSLPELSPALVHETLSQLLTCGALTAENAQYTLPKPIPELTLILSNLTESVTQAL